jgi:hypothetical protein
LQRFHFPDSVAHSVKKMKFVVDRKGSDGIVQPKSKRVLEKQKKFRDLNQQKFKEITEESLNGNGHVKPSVDPWAVNAFAKVKDREVVDEIYRDPKGFDVLIKKKLRNVSVFVPFFAILRI